MADLLSVFAEVAKDVGIAIGGGVATYLSTRKRAAAEPPAAPSPAPRASSSSLPAVHLPGSPAPRARVLVVDDEPSFARVIRRALAHLELDVDIAGTCAEARALAKLHPYVLLLVDLSLPDGDGLALIGELRTRTLLYTGASEDELAAARSAGVADRVLGKDASLDGLLAVVEELTGAKEPGA